MWHNLHNYTCINTQCTCTCYMLMYMYIIDSIVLLFDCFHENVFVMFCMYGSNYVCMYIYLTTPVEL